MKDKNQKNSKEKNTPVGFRKRYNRLVEIYVWLGIACLVVFPAYYYSLKHGVYDDFLLEFYNQFLLGAFLILIPILFSLIFGKLPIEYLRSRRESTSTLIQVSGVNNTVYTQKEEENKKLDNSFMSCIHESKSISEKILSKSGVYLFVGCLIAFIGVAIFYSPLFENSKSQDISQRLLDYLPRFGSLFFLEFIAFFFLKQYRIMLEEYRYYEAIKRKRQDNFNLIELIEKHKDNTDLLKLITENISTNIVTKLANGETTEILETQKLVTSDFDIFSKFTEMIKEVKSK